MVFTRDGRKRLLRLMVIQDVSQRQLAQGIGWKSHSYLGRFIRGEVPSIDAEAAVKIAHYLQVSVDDLFVSRASSDTRQNVERHGRAA